MGPGSRACGASARMAGLFLARFRADERDPHHVGRAGRAERDAGDDDDALAGLGEAFAEREPAGADRSSVSAIWRAASAIASAPVASGSVRCAWMMVR